MWPSDYPRSLPTAARCRSLSLSHPCVVTTYKLAVVCVKTDEELWLQADASACNGGSATGPGTAGSRESAGDVGSSGQSGVGQQQLLSTAAGGESDSGGGQQAAPLLQGGAAMAGGGASGSEKSLPAAAAGIGNVIWPQESMPSG